MFREMRRYTQKMSESECREILENGTSGVLAVSGDDGYPYAVPLSYALDGDRIYFHGALTGHKMDAARSCDKCSFCVIGCDEVVPERYTTRYKSVIVFGRIYEITDDEGRLYAARLMGRKYAPGNSEEQLQKEIDGGFDSMGVLAIEIEHMTGKMGREFLKDR